MVKHLVVIAAVLATLVVVDAAHARHRRGGCAGGNCYAGGGCPGGVCDVPVYSSKVVAEGPAPAPVAAQATPAPAVVTTQAAAPRYSNNVRRGWLARRRS